MAQQLFTTIGVTCVIGEIKLENMRQFLQIRFRINQAKPESAAYVYVNNTEP